MRTEKTLLSSMAMWGRTIEGLQNPKSVPLGTDRTWRFGREEKQTRRSFYSTTGNLVQSGGLEIFISVLILQGTTEKLSSPSFEGAVWFLGVIAPALWCGPSIRGNCLHVRGDLPCCKGSFSPLIKIRVDQFCCLWCQM